MAKVMITPEQRAAVTGQPMPIAPSIEPLPAKENKLIPPSIEETQKQIKHLQQLKAAQEQKRQENIAEVTRIGPPMQDSVVEMNFTSSEELQKKVKNLLHGVDQTPSKTTTSFTAAVNSTESAEKPVAETVSTPKPTQETTEERKLCGHCGWPSDLPPEPDPSPEDRAVFVAALCAQITGDRTATFTKIYTILGGKVRIAFRDLATDEVDAISAQTLRDYNAGEIKTQLEDLERRLRYRLALQLCWIEADNKKIELIGHMNDIELPENIPPANKLKYYLQHIQNNVLTTEGLFGVVRQAANQFNRLSAKLQISWDRDVDFWRGAETPL